jgi:poly-gamma-glutamate synthesis protein (capsule biosynthesis protein)
MKNYLRRGVLIIILVLSLGLWSSLTNFISEGEGDFAVDPSLSLGPQLKQDDLNSEMAAFIAARQELPDSGPLVSLLAVGDLSFSRGVEQTIIKNDNLEYPFAELDNFLSQADITFGNLETPLTPGRVIQSGEMIFRSDPKMAEVLRNQGFDIVSLANNHTPNFGAKGLYDTFNYLDEAGVAYVGAGEDGPRAYAPVYLERQGIKFAFIAHNDSDVVPAYYRADEKGPGTALIDEDELAAAISTAKEQADLVIVSLHSGTEYVPGPNSRQTKFAHAAIDFGADLVIGHHPHVVQTIEEYQGKYIFYSLGNFVFDQSWSQETADSLAVKFHFNKEGLVSFSLYPLRMYKLAQPAPVAPEDAKRILERLDWPLASTSDYVWQGGELLVQTQAGFLIKPAVQGNLKKKEKADLNNDGITEEYYLEKGRLTAKQAGNFLWETPETWWVEDFVVGDSNHDSKPEITIALWRSGDFNSKNYFWTGRKQNNLPVRQFLLVLQSDANGFKPFWASDALDSPHCSLFLRDVDDDTYQELVATIANYQNSSICEPQRVTVWRWSIWGFVLEWESELLEHLSFSSFNF